MPPRKGRAVRTKKHKKKLAEVMDISHSTSTNLNNKQANQAQEKFTAGIPEMMEQGEEAEMSLSNEMEERRNTFKVGLECIPLEQDLAEDIEASNKKNHTESISMVRRRPCPSFSLKLTEMANMCDDEDDDSVTQSWPVDTINGYKVKPESAPILRKIITKHGDIAKNCTELTMKDRSVLLEVICGIISELQEQNFSKMKEDFLRSKIALLNDMKNIEMDIEWLQMRLVEMLDARNIVNRSAKLKEERESNRKIIEVVESELKECEAEKKELSGRFESVCNRESVCKERLAAAMDVSNWITENVQYAKSQVARFLNRSLVDDLL